jgi:hypothetical protein
MGDVHTMVANPRPLSRVTWQTTVAHHPPEQRALSRLSSANRSATHVRQLMCDRSSAVTSNVALLDGSCRAGWKGTPNSTMRALSVLVLGTGWDADKGH